MGNSPQPQFTSIGGQAVIEGVMMRSPHYMAVAVRKPDQKIVLRVQPYNSVMDRFKFLKKPLLRGVVTLIESMVQGIDALGYSANAAGLEGNKEEEKLTGFAIAGSIITAFAFAMGLFVALPHFLTVVMTSSGSITVESPLFHLLDGLLKMIILLTYVYAISLLKDIRRVFQYHGAEHKSIYAFEKGEELTVANARKHTTLHPRCGTSFLLFLVLISICVFSIVFPVFGLTQLSPHKILNHVYMILAKMALMMPVAGLAYEFIKMCACRMDHFLYRALIWPGLILQKLTTREPDDQQLEVALASLRIVLQREKSEKNEDHKIVKEIEITKLDEILPVAARVSEFLEA